MTLRISVEGPGRPVKLWTQLSDHWWLLELVGPDGPRRVGQWSPEEVVISLRDEITEGRV